MLLHFISVTEKDKGLFKQRKLKLQNAKDPS